MGPYPLEDGKYFNRDLAWLEFNRRVLAQATDDDTPLLERVKFLAIFASNLDEFFMKRVGLLRRRVELGQTHSPTRPGELPPKQTLAEIRKVVAILQKTQADCWKGSLQPALAEAGILVSDYDSLGRAERDHLDDWYRAEVFPILTPLAVDPGHRFPFISNLSVNLGVLLDRPSESGPSSLFARVKIPSVLPQFVRVDALGDGPSGPGTPVTFVPLDDVIRHNLDELFPGMTVRDVLPFRVTRNAAIEIDDEETEDLLEQVELELRMRRFANALRLQINPGGSSEVLDFVSEELGLVADDIYERPGPLAFTDLFEIAELDRPDLKERPWTPVVPRALADQDVDIFSIIRARDVLVHHPYESFQHSAERFIAEAARDRNVLAIKQTLYRTSQDSPFIEHLIEAAEDGKQVACLVELRARFDEEKNVQFARQLEAAGVHVAYGVVGLKTHCKCSLVVRRETQDRKTALRTYCHIGTGNYHPRTAQLYTDCGLFTAHPGITADVARLFNALTGHAAEHEYEHLLVAPSSMRDAFNALIDKEIKNAGKGRPAHIIAKMNALEDRQLTGRLYEASRAGVKIDLIVRGFCCLQPGVEGLSENIRVRSVVGRFLEHSRIFYFANGKEDPVAGKFFISSADWMHRNLNNRVEAMAPVLDAGARRDLSDAMHIMLRDQREAWDLQPTGVYDRTIPPESADPDSPEVLGTFRTLMNSMAADAGPMPA